MRDVRPPINTGVDYFFWFSPDCVTGKVWPPMLIEPPNSVVSVFGATV